MQKWLYNFIFIIKWILSFISVVLIDTLCVSGNLQSCATVGHTLNFCAGSSKGTEENSSNDPIMEDHGY